MDMSVQSKFYRLLKEDIKTVEIRLFDEKRRLIKVGDIIRFCNLKNKEDYFMARVVYLHQAKHFRELPALFPIQKAGFSSKAEMLEALRKFYSFEAEEKFGVVGIEVKKINSDA